MSKIITNKWIPCSDENYWSDEEGYVTIVKVPFEEWHEESNTIKRYYIVYTRKECPYGWNVLCKAKAELMNIKY